MPSTVDPAGKTGPKVSYDAILVAGAGLVGAFLFFRKSSTSSTAAGYAPGAPTVDPVALENGILSDPAFWGALSQQMALNTPPAALPMPAAPPPLASGGMRQGGPPDPWGTLAVVTPFPVAGNPFIGPTGWLPAGVSAADPLSIGVYGIYEHDLGRAPTAAEETFQLQSIQKIGWQPFETAVWNSPESKAFQATHPGLQSPTQ
jgi:hypothetical protein